MADEQNSPQIEPEKVSASDRRLASAASSGIIKTEGDQAKPAPKPEVKPDPDASKNDEANKNLPEITDEQLMEGLKKRGVTATSLEELKPKGPEKTEEEKIKEKEERRQRAIAFGIKNKVFSQNDYDASVKFGTQKAQEFMQAQFVAELQKDDPTLSDEDAVDAFKEKYFLLEAPESTKYKRGQKDLENEFNAIKQQKYGKIDDIETVYDQVEKSEARAKVFKGEMERIFTTEIPKTIPITIKDAAGNSHTLNAPIDTAILNQLKDNYLTFEMMEALTDQTGKLSGDTAKEEILKDLFWNNREAIFAEVANAYAEKRLADDRKGRKGIILPEFAENNNSGTKVLTPSEKKMASAGIK